MRQPLVVIALAAAFLASCDSELDRAKRQYAMVNKVGATHQEKCNAAREVERAALRAEDQQEYEMVRVTAGLDCNAAELERIAP